MEYLIFLLFVFTVPAWLLARLVPKFIQKNTIAGVAIVVFFIAGIALHVFVRDNIGHGFPNYFKTAIMFFLVQSALFLLFKTILKKDCTVSMHLMFILLSLGISTAPHWLFLVF